MSIYTPDCCALAAVYLKQSIVFGGSSMPASHADWRVLEPHIDVTTAPLYALMALVLPGEFRLTKSPLILFPALTTIKPIALPF